ncbi:MAG: carbon-nitrogen hydrolase family protein [Gammaproteobacteria bacterium]|nr:carbon-nitrogen hydrolase family protein [Gammaproteobacteria bacterium]MDH5692054.1 carbon-nitrogen hydrolase family protein [Gammaproteobacteria bacterium]
MNKVAAIQMASGPNVEANLFEVDRLIAQAVEAGAELVVLPENFYQMGMNEADKVKVKERLGEGPVTRFLAEKAKQKGIWIVGGTAPLESSDPKRIRSACLVFNPQGKCVARYDKVHLFDVSLVDANERYNESSTIEAGEETVVVDTPFGKLGLAICYDLRFPELFRQLLSKGAEVIAVPSAFTAITGRAHWETLVRARAIENLSYVVAAAQGGYHVNGRETHGDSMIVDPWGNILDRLPRGSGVVIAEIDRERLLNTRRNFPAVDHRKLA